MTIRKINSNREKANNQNSATTQDEKSNLNVAIDEIPDGSHVFLKSFHCTNRCIVRHVSEEKEKKRQQIIRTVEEIGRSQLMPLSKIPKRLTHALTKLENGPCERAIIISIKRDTHIRVLLIDYGVYVFRKLTQLFEMPKDLYKLKQLNILVRLHDVKDVLLNENIVKLHSGLKGVYELRYWGDERRRYNVTLLDLKTNESLNHQLRDFYESENLPRFSRSETIHSQSSSAANEKPREDAQKNEHSPEKAIADASAALSGNAGPGLDVVRHSKEQFLESELKLEPVMKCPFKKVLFHEGDKNISAVILDVSHLRDGGFSCIASENLCYLETVYKFLNPMKNDKPYAPRTGEYCIAKYCDEWFRAQVIEMKGNGKVVVLYCDYGNSGEVAVDDIRRYPMELTIPCHTVVCLCIPETDGFPKLQDFLEKSIKLHSEIMIDLVNTRRRSSGDLHRH